MKKLLKKIFVLILIFTVMLMYYPEAVLNNTIEVEAYSGIPAKIRVGINYSDSAAKDTFTIIPSTAYGLGYVYNKGAFTKLIDLPAGTKIFVRKDDYFYQGSSQPIKYNLSSSTPSQNKFGPYRIQIGGALSNYSEAFSKATEYKTKYGVNCYPFFRTSWYVCTGDYTSSDLASAGINELKKTNSSIEYKVVSATSTTVVVQNSSFSTILVFDGSSSFTNVLQVAPASSSSTNKVQVNTPYYRGVIEFRRYSGKDMTLINELDFEQYIYGVLPNEIGYSGLAADTLKAHAVATRTYAYMRVRGTSKHDSHGFDLCDTTDCQSYGGCSKERDDICSAVDATKNQVITYNGNPISDAVYSSSDGGYSDNAETVWGGSQAYLKAVKDPYDPIDERSVVMTAQEASDTLNAKGYNIGTLSLIEVRNRSVAGRITELYIKGSKGEVTIKNNGSRGAFGLRSQMFKMSTDVVLTEVSGELGMQLLDKLSGKYYNKDFINAGTYTVNRIPPGGTGNYNGYYFERIVISDMKTNITFTTRGYGHGLGMSQKGIIEMGKQGMNYVDMLKFYYKGINVE